MNKEEKIIKASYEMAEKIYRINYKSFFGYSIDLEDFQQDAVMYILKLYRDGYMYTDDSYDIRGMIFTMLRQYVLNYLRKYYRRSKRMADNIRQNNLGEFDTNYLVVENIPALPNNKEVEETVVMQESIEQGKKVLGKIIQNFSISPLKTRKHIYINTENNKISEYQIAKLVTEGHNIESILKEYNVYTSNIGTSSKAVFVYRKVQEVLDKLKTYIEQLEENDKKAVALYAKMM